MNIYIDFKNYVEFLCIAHKGVLNIEQELYGIDLTINSLIDIILFIEALV